MADQRFSADLLLSCRSRTTARPTDRQTGGAGRRLSASLVLDPIVRFDLRLTREEPVCARGQLAPVAPARKTVRPGLVLRCEGRIG